MYRGRLGNRLLLHRGDLRSAPINPSEYTVRLCRNGINSRYRRTVLVAGKNCSSDEFFVPVKIAIRPRYVWEKLKNSAWRLMRGTLVGRRRMPLASPGHVFDGHKRRARLDVRPYLLVTQRARWYKSVERTRHEDPTDRPTVRRRFPFPRNARSVALLSPETLTSVAGEHLRQRRPVSSSTLSSRKYRSRRRTARSEI